MSETNCNNRMVSAGYEVMLRTAEYDWEQSSGPYETFEKAEEVMLNWFRKEDIPHMRVVQFFCTNKLHHEQT